MAEKGVEVVPPSFDAVFIDTSIGTHLVVPVTISDTVSELKEKIVVEHSLCFPDVGLLQILGLKVKRRGKLYHVSESMVVKNLFHGIKGNWFLSVDVSPSKDHVALVSCSHDNRIACDEIEGDVYRCHSFGERGVNQSQLSIQDCLNQRPQAENLGASRVCSNRKLDDDCVDGALACRKKNMNHNETDVSKMECQRTASFTPAPDLYQRDSEENETSGVCNVVLHDAEECVGEKMKKMTVCSDVPTKQLPMDYCMDQPKYVEVAVDRPQRQDNLLTREHGEELSGRNETNDQNVLPEHFVETKHNEESESKVRQSSGAEGKEQSQTHSDESDSSPNHYSVGWLDHLVTNVVTKMENTQKNGNVETGDKSRNDLVSGEYLPEACYRGTLNDSLKGSLNNEQKAVCSESGVPTRGQMSRKKKAKKIRTNDSMIDVGIDDQNDPAKDGCNGDQTTGTTASPIKRSISRVDKNGVYQNDINQEFADRASRSLNNLECEDPSFHITVEREMKNGMNDKNYHVKAKVRGRKRKERAAEQITCAEIDRDGLQDVTFQEELKVTCQEDPLDFAINDSKGNNLDLKRSSHVDDRRNEDLAGICQSEDGTYVAENVDFAFVKRKIKHAGDPEISSKKAKQLKRKKIHVEPGREISGHDVQSINHDQIADKEDTHHLNDNTNDAEKSLKEDLCNNSIIELHSRCVSEYANPNPDGQCIEEKTEKALKRTRERKGKKRSQSKAKKSQGNENDTCDLEGTGHEEAKNMLEKTSGNSPLVPRNSVDECNESEEVKAKLASKRDSSSSNPEEHKGKENKAQLGNETSGQIVDYNHYNQLVNGDNTHHDNARITVAEVTADISCNSFSDVLTQKERDNPEIERAQNDGDMILKSRKKQRNNRTKSSEMPTERGKDDYPSQELSANISVIEGQNRPSASSKDLISTKGETPLSNGLESESLGKDDGINFIDYFASSQCQDNAGSDQVSVVTEKQKESKTTKKNLAGAKRKKLEFLKLDNIMQSEHNISGSYSREKVNSSKLERRAGEKITALSTHVDDSKRKLVDSYPTSSSENSWSSDGSVSESHTEHNSVKRGFGMQDSQKQTRRKLLPSLSLNEIFRSSSSYKKAKVNASRSILDGLENLPLDFVPDSCPNS